MPFIDEGRAITIVGAGVAGLTIGYQLAHRGFHVTIIEQQDVAGGLARSWHYGDFHFDVGPHRFHTENPRVAAFIREVLREEAVEIPRRSGVRMFGRFHEWPLRPGILLSMPVKLMVLGTKDLLIKERLEGDSFEADVVNKYGRTLYEIFFKPYTEKFLFASPADLHRDWGRAGVNRAVIDKRAASESLWDLLKNTLLPKPVDTMFLYPPTGVGRFSERLAEGIRDRGGDLLLGHPVTAVRQEAGRVIELTAGGKRIPCENLVWTAPLTLLNRLLGREAIDLRYLSTLFYNLEINKPARHDYQWTYYGGDEIFSRVSAPQAFVPTTVPPGKSALCVELTCREGDERWRDPGAYTSAIVADLVRTRTIDSPADVERVHVERVRNTYPIYKLNYLSELTRGLRELGQYRNLLLAGRCGRFWYNNMDHSIGQGLTMADRIAGGQVLADIDTADREFWAAGEEPCDNLNPTDTHTESVSGGSLLKQYVKSLIAAAAIAATAACGNSGSREVPATPTAPDGGASNAANITAPGVDSPADDAQLDTLRPTLRVTNATSSGSGSRTYEFQISDSSTFAVVSGLTAAVAFTQSGVPEGSDGKTSVTPNNDLLPATRYYWRARAIQGTSTGPWSNTGRFRTKIDSFKSGNMVFDILTNGRTVADLQNDIAFIGGSDPNPGLKLNSTSSYLGYRITALPEGEVSAVVRRVKPGGSDFEGQTRLFQMLDGTGDANGNAFRVLVDKFREEAGGVMRFEFRTPAGGNALNSGGQNWVDGETYFLKVEWRAGNARLRVFNGDNEGAPVKLDLSTTYGAPYNPSNHTVTFGSLTGGTIRDVRLSRVYIGPYPRPVSLGSALQP